MISSQQAENLLLINRIRAGDQDALDQMVQRHIPLVQSCLKRFHGRGKDMEELYQQGCLGLVKACKRFDPAYKVCFSTYAVPLILGEIRRFLRDDQPYHLVRQDKERMAKLHQLTSQLTQTLGREPTVDELAKGLRMDASELMLLMESRSAPISFDQALPGERPLAEKLGSPEQWLEEIFIRDLIHRLPPKDRQLIYLRFAAGHTQAQTAQVLGVSQVQVSRLEKRICAVLQKQWHTG